MAQLILSRGGHDVVPATTAAEALRFLEQKRFDVVISDLSLGPGMNGWELAARVRERWPSTPVVLATGWGATLDNADAQGRGVEAVIAKPYRAPELLSIVSRCVM
jgi:CheY-like chemotaxis protein